MNLENAVALVTGSSSGVGAATVKLLAAKGCRVVVNYSSSVQAAQDVAAECEKSGAEVLLCQADVSKDEDCRRLVDETMRKWGRLDALVNNAGTTKFVNHRDLSGLDKQDFLEIYAVNVVGPYQMTRAAEAPLRESGDAAIVNIASIAGIKGVGSSIAYAASKGALITMTRSLARVLGPEIRVNTICPGFIEGKWLEQGIGPERYRQARDMAAQRAPLGKTCTAESVAESIQFFVEGASIVTGETLILDGGSNLN